MIHVSNLWFYNIQRINDRGNLQTLWQTAYNFSPEPSETQKLSMGACRNDVLSVDSPHVLLCSSTFLAMFSGFNAASPVSHAD